MNGCMAVLFMYAALCELKNLHVQYVYALYP